MATIDISTLKPPSAEEWQRIKSTFLQLYLEDNKKLEEVRAILANEHNFVAT